MQGGVRFPPLACLVFAALEAMKPRMGNTCARAIIGMRRTRSWLFLFLSRSRSLGLALSFALLRGCGAFGNDHSLKFLQQWLAASAAGVKQLHYHTFGDKRSGPLFFLATSLKKLSNVGELWALVRDAANQCSAPGPGAAKKFLSLMEAHGKEVNSRPRK